MDALTFHAELEDVPGVGAYVAVRVDQGLTALHDVVREAFGWYDDHLYSFWLDGRFWGDRDSEYTRPEGLDDVGDSVRTADVAVGSLDLAVGQRIAYVFDFGDEWRVRLTVKAIGAADGDEYPRILERLGEAPPQYPDPED
ncbi:MAG: plasmid pRiA4b ORF-3 family protein [Actinomycetota bacterium]|nr:plasmid pRiA4b ORF-3 family protein [Actinomycetota bacterium]